MFTKKSTLLKAAIFATGFSGVVAEYILSTLATYFLGDSIFQWIMIISLMLFSMGLGSRVSKSFHTNLLKKFLLVEFTLSILVAFSPLAVYTISAYSDAYGLIIYMLAIGIGMLIGMEVPLVIRINEEFEQLRYNISNILENDYYGSLLGGVFFAFIGLPILGLTYTPFVLGLVNFSVAVLLMLVLWKLFSSSDKKTFIPSGIFVLIVLVGGLFMAKPIIQFGEQAKYKDKVIFQKQTTYQRIVMTQWKDDYWLYLNGNQQLCTRDEVMYHEPLVHPAMTLHPHPAKVLVLGGGDGCAVREILKYPTVESVKLIDLDPEMTKLGQTSPVLTKLNQNSLNNEKVTIVNTDGFQYIQKDTDTYDVIIIDLPDPRTVELGRLYSQEFYEMCYRQLRPQGVIITQAGSPYFATKAFQCIETTMAAAGFTTVPIHNQVVTMGEWGWSLGQKQSPYPDLQSTLRRVHFSVPTQWIDNEAMQLITSFGKDTYWLKDTEGVEVNSIHHPVLYQYYLKGNWDLY
ncbi:polyamine aminopropyltransferase 1 [Neptunitalea chrysea]|uniref:Polyamine aminopropyltransferase n=1 Tax=Neptunitalea chrysea TaxID=1647581 RepID=A0A9W6B8S9_9FLAO|nr:polyamine aminopropyltransferase [Neptunitalea chrysea]GLB53083.1 polyamine aminopropyltransferase 1 [Neptunitalea chrysea]